MRIILLFSLLVSVQCFGQIWDFEGVSKLAGTVNTEAEEGLPVFSKDSSNLYFIRAFDKNNAGGENDQDIYVAKKQADGSYGNVKPLSSFNTKFNNGVVGVGRVSGSLYTLDAYEGKKDLVKGIAMATSKGTGWNSPVRIEVPTLDIEGDFYGFHISDDENVMLISYKGPGSMGEEDLYYTTKSEAGWSTPINLGSSINTAGFEMSPFLSPNQDTLFFSSNGHGGLGDADIFYSVRQGSWTNWSTPVNLGPKINSAKYDACFSYSGNQVYWASNRDSELSDIYTAYMILPPPLVVNCSAIDATKFQEMNGSVDLTISGGVAPYSITWSNGTTSEDLLAVGKGDYTAIVTDSWNKQAITTCSVSEPAPLELPIITTTAYKNLELINYFDYNKNKLTVDKGDLRRFIKDVEKQLKEGRPNITINIYSSASHVPTKTYETNEKLANIRAENMKYDLTTYFEGKSDFKGKVNVVIVSAIVDGPEYVQDAGKTNKYKPYQFVGLKTE